MAVIIIIGTVDDLEIIVITVKVHLDLAEIRHVREPSKITDRAVLIVAVRARGAVSTEMDKVVDLIAMVRAVVLTVIMVRVVDLIMVQDQEWAVELQFLR